MSEAATIKPGPVNVLRFAPDDDVAIAIRALDSGDSVLDDVVACEPIAAGHKVALRAMAEGDLIYKYGQVIAVVTTAIACGAHVHLHNAAMPAISSAGRAAAASKVPAVARATPSLVARTFEGFHRQDGRVGTRNFVGIVTTVNCSATVARLAAKSIEDRLPLGIDGVVAIRHSSGCSAAGGDSYAVLQRTLAAYARHPNFGGVVILGLGCEDNHIAALLEEEGLKPGDQLAALDIQDLGGTRSATDAVADRLLAMAEQAASLRRLPAGLEHLCVGLQCGGSDAYSGITANPALGAASDLIAQHGGTTVLSETPEIYGAEHLLMRRAQTPLIAEKLAAHIRWWEQHALANAVSLDNNPSHGNKLGGITTIFEKSMGAVAKGGNGPLVAVADYAEQVSGAGGLVFMDTPGNDVVSVTGQIAGGCNVICFTTGRGSVFGCRPSPSLKLATNSAMYAKLADDMDVNCGRVLDEGVGIAAMGEEIFEMIIATASGRKTRSELLGHGEEEFSAWHRGLTL